MSQSQKVSGTYTTNRNFLTVIIGLPKYAFKSSKFCLAPKLIVGNYFRLGVGYQSQFTLDLN